MEESPPGPAYITMNIAPSEEHDRRNVAIAAPPAPRKVSVSTSSPPAFTRDLSIPGWPSAGDAFQALAIDANTTGVPRSKLLEIARRFQPAVWLHADEAYRPCTIDWYLENVNLYYDPDGTMNMKNYLLMKERPVQADLTEPSLRALLEKARVETQNPKLQGIKPETLNFNNFHMALTSTEAQSGVSFSDMKSVPFLSRVRRHQDHWEIAYIFIFAYNGPFKVCGAWHDAHSCDLEHMTVRTNEDGTKLEWIYYGAHGIPDGVWRQPHEIELLPADMPWPTRPVGYASEHSHGMYPNSGTWWRICGFANDLTGGKSADSHSLWSPTVDPIVLFDSKDPRYKTEPSAMPIQEYMGTMGEVGGRSPQDQSFWNEETSWQNNFFRRCLWPCRYIECNGQDVCYNNCQKQVDFTKGAKMIR